jgi:hypothetical protein
LNRPLELYANALVKFQDACSDFPLFLKYVMTTLNEVKEKIVRAWIDHVLHLGWRTNSRVESAHALVKKYLDNSVGDLGTCWEKITCWFFNSLRYKQHLVRALPYWNIDSKISPCTPV